MTDYKGKCLCGAVTFTVEVAKPEVGACHCSMCQTWGAGPTLMVHETKAPVVEDASQLGVYAASPWGERCFCKQCGSSLFWRMKDGSFHAVSLAALEDANDFSFHSEIFIDEKPAYYSFAGERLCMTGAEVFAAISGEAHE